VKHGGGGESKTGPGFPSGPLLVLGMPVPAPAAGAGLRWKPGNACCSHALARPRRVKVHRRHAVHAGATREMKSRGESVEKETWEILFTVRS